MYQSEEGIAKDKEKSEIINIRINSEWRKRLELDKKILQQKKDGTAIKQLVEIGSKVIHDNKMRAIIDILFNNKRKNERGGIVEFK